MSDVPKEWTPTASGMEGSVSPRAVKGAYTQPLYVAAFERATSGGDSSK